MGDADTPRGGPECQQPRRVDQKAADDLCGRGHVRLACEPSRRIAGELVGNDKEHERDDREWSENGCRQSLPYRKRHGIADRNGPVEMPIAQPESLQAVLIAMRSQEYFVVAPRIRGTQSFDAGGDDAAALDSLLRIGADAPGR